MPEHFTEYMKAGCISLILKGINFYTLVDPTLLIRHLLDLYSSLYVFHLPHIFNSHF